MKRDSLRIECWRGLWEEGDNQGVRHRGRTDESVPELPQPLGWKGRSNGMFRRATVKWTQHSAKLRARIARAGPAADLTNPRPRLPGRGRPWQRTLGTGFFWPGLLDWGLRVATL